jgi:hypothetical protein
VPGVCVCARPWGERLSCFVVNALATEPILLNRSAGIRLICLVFTDSSLNRAASGPTISEVSFPSLHTDAGVTGR